MGLHMGICRGPVDELVAIKAGDRDIWKYDPSAPALPSPASFAAYDAWKASGDPFFLMPSIARPAYYYEKDDRVNWPIQVTGNQTLRIKAANIFGGEESEGGIDGTLDVMFGADDQPVNSRLQQMLGGLVPAYRKRLTAMFDGMVCAMSKYPKPWAFRVRRVLNGWDGGVWYSAKAKIILDSGKIHAMNPAHIVYECLTNRDWGRGIPRAKLDDAAFKAAADALWDEAFGLCLKWSRQDKIGNFIQLVLNHVGANLFVSRTTGLWTLRLVRENYNVETIPQFDADSGLLGIDDDENTADVVAANQIIVNYTRPSDNTEGSEGVQNAAAIRAAGGVLSESIDYPGIPTPELALRVAQRDLRAKFGVKKFKVRLDRRGYKVEPGGVFRVSDPSRGIENLVLRAGRIEDGVLSAGTITISAVMDVFGLPANSYVAVQQPLYTPPSFVPEPVAQRLVAEATYRDLVGVVDTATFEAITPGTNFITALGAAPSGLSYGYQLNTRLGSTDWKSTDADFTPTATITTAIVKGAAPATVSLDNLNGLEAVTVGTAAAINGEIFRVTVLNLETKTATLARGCIDTVPASHAIGSRIWFYQDGIGVDTTEYAAGVTVDVQMLTKTGAGKLSSESAAIDSHTITRRRERPYVPGNVKINSVAYPAKINGALTISWSHRDRTLQADQLIDTTLPSVGPEPGTSYSMSAYGDGILIGSLSGSTDSSFTLSISDEKGAGLFHLPHNLIMRAPGLAAVASTESTNLDPYPSEAAGFYVQQFAKVTGGWLTFNNVGSTVRGVYVDTTTGAKTTRNYDLVTNTRTQLVTLISSAPKLDPYYAALLDSSFTGWATYWDVPGNTYNGYVNDSPGIFRNPPFKDRRTNPTHIVVCNYGLASLAVSAQTYKDIRRLNYVTYALHVVTKSAVQTGPMATTRTEIEAYWLSTANQFNALTGTPDAVPPYMPPTSLMSAYNAQDLIYETGVIFGSVLYVHYHRGTGSETTAGKTLDISNVISSGHLPYKTGSELATKTYTITSGGALTPLTTRVGFYLADQLNSTQGFEVLYSTRQVWLVNSTTGAQGALLGTLSFDPCAVYGDTTNEYIYVLGADGTLRKFDNTLTLLSSLPVGTTDRALAWKLRQSDIKESASVLYVRYAGVTYEVKKDLSSARSMLGYTQTFPGYANSSSSIVLMSNGDEGLADENGISSTIFNQPKPRVAGSLTVALSATRDGLTSHQSHSISTVRAAYGLRYGHNYRG